MVHFREYWNKNGRYLPTQKGIGLTTTQFRQLASDMQDIVEDVDEI